MTKEIQLQVKAQAVKWKLSTNILKHDLHVTGNLVAYLLFSHVCRLRSERVAELHRVGNTLCDYKARNVAKLLRQALGQKDQVILTHWHEGDQVCVMEVEGVGVVIRRDKFLAVLHLYAP